MIWKMILQFKKFWDLEGIILSQKAQEGKEHDCLTKRIKVLQDERLEGMSYDEIRPIFKKVWISIITLCLWRFEIEKEKKKPAENNFLYYKIIRGDGSSKNYKILSEMLYDFDRQDVVELYRLVKERYSSSKPEGYDLMLWGDLHTLFEPDEESEIWVNQNEYDLIKKKYPLSQEMISKMLSKRLEVDHESTQAYELLKFIRSQVKK
ncbi:hypothetical protein Tco_0951327 [Tanacetum coccineum]|uniref:Uncharacterized protein n=1 Tax=Tanacetum coccineum TaxID=301880 RepID=A0ABQ5DTV3_9ASTR